MYILKSVIIMLSFLFISCDKRSREVIYPEIKFTQEKIVLINNTNKDLYDLHIIFAKKYIKNLDMVKSKSVKVFTYQDINASSRLLSKNSIEMSYQDLSGNNYLFIKPKNVISNSGINDNGSWVSKSLEILSANFITIILALLAGLIALYQVKSNIISSSRIKWNEDFKQIISEYVACVNETIVSHSNYDKTDSGESSDQKEFYNQYTSSHYKSTVLGTKILLNLNVKEQLHKEIEELIEKIENELDGENILNVESKLITQDLYNIILKSRLIFKEEWEKTKKLIYIKRYESFKKRLSKKT